VSRPRRGHLLAAREGGVRVGVALVLVLMLAQTLAGGCNRAGKPSIPGDQVPIADGPRPLPPYAEVARAVNARADRLELYWAFVLLKVWYVGEQGEDEVEQLEGDLHVVRPARISLILQKLGVNAAALGANDRYYWWMDLAADEPVASIGTHAMADPDRLSDFGVPVHPLDLLELLGLSPIAQEPPATADVGVPMGYTRGGRLLIVRAPARWGVREYWLDPETYEPRRAVLRRGIGQPPALTAELSEYQPFDDGTDAPPVRVPKYVLVDVPQLEARVRIRMVAPQAGGRRPDERAFQLADLLARFGVTRRRDLDEVHRRPPPAGSPAGASP